MKAKFSLRSYVFTEIRDGLAIIRDGKRPNSLLKKAVFAEIGDGLAISMTDEGQILFKKLSFC